MCLAPYGGSGGRSLVNASLDFDASTVDVRSGESVTLHLKATALSGHSVTVPSPPLLVDLTPPTSGSVLDRFYVEGEDAREADVDAVLPSTMISAWWVDFDDDESGISHYSACVGSAPTPYCSASSGATSPRSTAPSPGPRSPDG